MKKLLLLLITFLTGLQCLANNIPFTLSGLQSGDKVIVTISSDAYLKTMDVAADGSYMFSDVPEGKHYIKVEANGYNLPDSKAVIVNADGSINPQTGISLVITKMDGNGTWTHSWHEDGSVSGYTTTAYVNKPAEITYLGKKIVPADVPSQSILENDYNIILSDNGISWTQEYAYRLLETMKTMPNHILGNDSVIIKLTDQHITDDIQIENLANGLMAEISTDAFVYANPFYVNLDGVRGRFFSKRLHHAIVNMVTNYGTDKDRADQILRDRFGCSIYPPSYEELTQGITNEDANCFQEFVARELVEIINMFEEMPEGFHKIPHLNYLIRRQNGHVHPLYPGAAAVTWAVDNGYIEFMEKAFSGDVLFETQRLILHEKTHMLWAFSFSEQIKNDWITLGGWYLDPNASDGWATTKDTEFVSAYSHAHNPNEDMAESVAFYIKNPDKLMSRSLPKYEFIRDRIMHGTRYISKIREDLTFEVLNLFPDYDYPGKIKSLDVSVIGQPNEDKIVEVDITLNHMEGFNDGAHHAFLRMTTPKFKDTKGEIRSQFRDLYLDPVDGDAWHLKGQLTLSKYSKSGYWTVGDIVITDEQENQRYEGANDFVWNMYVDNSMEDLESPVYEKGSLRYNLTNVEVEGHQAQNLEVIYKVTDDTGISSTFVRLCRKSEDTYSYADEYGTYDPETHEAHVNFLITEFYPTDDYFVSWLIFRDLAGTDVSVDFSDSPQDEPLQTIHITTPNPDTEYPELDLNRIFVYAEPTHPEAPDGETLVTINYYARDNKSGLGRVNFRLRDPQGVDHFEWHYHRNFYTRYFDGDPTVWERYTINIILPQGSAPGIWGLSELYLEDKAINFHTYNFVETLIFEPDENQNDYVLFAEMKDSDILNFNLSALGSVTGYSFVYRVISEENGQEITGTLSNDSQIQNILRRGESIDGYNIDVSSLPEGKLVLIVQIKDETGNNVAIRTKTLYREIRRAGDANGDKEVNVVDIVEVVNDILGHPTANFVRAAADLNGDGEIDVMDVVMIVSIILSTDGNRAAMVSIEDTNNDMLTLENNDAQTLSLRLENKARYVASQFDLRIADGQTLESIMLNSSRCKNHQLTYAQINDNLYRVVVYSMSNNTFEGNLGELLTINLKGKGNVTIDNILFITSAKTEKRFSPLGGGTTGIKAVETTKAADIYSIDGRLVRKQAESTDGLKKGIYIINGKKHIVR